MAAAPVRQRSAAAGPRSQLPPCYYEGYLEKRGPREKVGPPPVSLPCCLGLHVVFCEPTVRGAGACACAGQPADLSFPELSTSSLCSHWARREWTLVLPGGPLAAGDHTV